MVRDWKSLFRNTGQPATDANSDIDPARLPAHVAVIMDGNGRWAHSRGLPRAAGHHAGMNAMRETIRAADDVGIRALTLYAFSTENWKRPLTEIQYLWRLLDEFFRSDMNELEERNVRVTFIGDTGQLPVRTQATIRQAINRTVSNTGMIVQFALNYGSRAEMVQAVRNIAEQVKDGVLGLDDIDEATLSQCLETRGIPDPDLLIRTAGDLRISNFLLWQIAYTELCFVKVMWPDFTREHLFSAIRDFGLRERRFGGIK